MSVDLTPGIVRILKPDGTIAGTGFVVNDEGLIATCAHVVWPKEAQEAGLPRPDTVHLVFHATEDGGAAEVVEEWWRHPDEEDVAILRLDGALPKGVLHLPLGSSGASKGHDFSSRGYRLVKQFPQGLEAEGRIQGHIAYKNQNVLQLLTNQIDEGMSGAPLWDVQGRRVVGMVNAFWQTKRHVDAWLAFAIPVETLRQVCPALRLPEGEPYRGLQVFEAGHANLYFGREAATGELLQALSQRDAVLLVGVSGSGKSSLVRAGLEKGLRAQPVPGLAERVRYLVLPGSEPLLNLVLALGHVEGLVLSASRIESVVRAFGLPGDALAEANRTATAQALNPRSPRALAAALRACAAPQGLLLIVDQFERLYTECDDETLQDRYIRTLLAAAGDSVKVLLTLRADFYGLALAHPGLEQVVRQGGQVTLGHMTEDNLRAAIEKPARALGRSFESRLVERLVNDVSGQAGDLPLLEFALTELWQEDNQKGVLTFATYEALGYQAPDGRRFPGVQGTVAQRAEVVWQGLDDAERRAARRVFLGLIIPGPVDEQGERLAEDTGRRAWRADWRTGSGPAACRSVRIRARNDSLRG